MDLIKPAFKAYKQDQVMAFHLPLMNSSLIAIPINAINVVALLGS